MIRARTAADRGQVKKKAGGGHPRIDPGVKARAERILKASGFTLSQGIHLFLLRVIAEGALPFKAKAPNRKTRAAQEAARRGKVETVTWEALRRESGKGACGK